MLLYRSIQPATARDVHARPPGREAAEYGAFARGHASALAIAVGEAERPIPEPPPAPAVRPIAARMPYSLD